MMKKILILLIALICTAGLFAQKDKTITFNNETNLIDVVYYHDNGEVSQTGSFNLDGKLEGNWISFDNKGNKLVSAFYNDGKKVGKWIHWIDGTQKVVSYSDNIASL